MKPKSWIVAVTSDGHPAVVRVRVIGSQNDWRLVQPYPYRRENGFEFGIHRRYVHDSWISAWRAAKASARRVKKRISGECPERVCSYPTKREQEPNRLSRACGNSLCA